jgi:adenosylcobinamide kinase/adenosylcobinamide-phosphate guanylyltransferase
VSRRVLVLGGSRSGKSAFAEALLGSTADYVATAPPRPDDPDWTARVAAHRARRPPAWRTVETADPAALLRTAGPDTLVDSVTAWLTRTLDDCGYWTADTVPAGYPQAVERLCSAWRSTPRFAVAVSDEVGLGVVPETASGRRFRDELGTLNQRLAVDADEVHLVVAGLAVRLK